MAELEGNGFKCWISSRDIDAGEDWAECIYSAISNSMALVLVYTDNVNDSWQIRNELDIATNLKIPIVPLLFKKTPIAKGLKYFTNSHQWLDCTTKKVKTPEILSSLGKLANRTDLVSEKPESKGKIKLIGTFAAVLLLLLLAFSFHLIRGEQSEADCSDLINLAAGETDAWNYASDIMATDDNGFIAAGTWDWGFYSEVWIARFDSTGNLVYSWSDSLTGECKPKLVPTENNGCITAFATYANREHTGFTFHALRFDSILNPIWTEEKWINFEGAVQPLISSLFYLPDSTLVSSFTLRLYNSGDYNAHYVKFDPTTGESKAFILPDIWESRSSVAYGTNILHVGADNSLQTKSNLISVIDTDGNTINSVIYGDKRSPIECIIALPDSSIVLAGTTDSYGGTKGDISIIKLSADLSLDWEISYGGDLREHASELILLDNGNLLFAGGTESSGSGNMDALLLYINPDGEIENEITIDNKGSDYIYSITQRENGNILISGITTYFNNRDAWLFEVTPEGYYNEACKLGIDLFTEDWESGYVDQNIWNVAFHQNYTPEIISDSANSNYSLNTNNLSLMLREKFAFTPGLSFETELTIPYNQSSSGGNWVAFGTTDENLETFIHEAYRAYDSALYWKYTPDTSTPVRQLQFYSSRFSPCSISTLPESLFINDFESQLFTIENCSDSLKFLLNNSQVVAWKYESSPDSVSFFLSGASMGIPHRIDNIRIFLRRW